ncbi:IS3 family transposase [Microbulbifer spongiae]|uniref:IS3 family transposase n=1 Tax=Microbulbifer spongiae TaxID=2944933 RepID=A0ABY9E6L9_9GAMM|nr:IS3 family transposase [Microbulbifer sp. MI-G]WKD48669.1 IS3 family transposase [Microbulbifer sp. MI-G]
MSKRPGYSPEVRERAVRMVLTGEHEHQSRWAAITSIASKIGCTPETLRSWVNKMEVDNGTKPGTTSSDAARLKELEREVRELKRANEILRKAAAFFGPGGARPQTEVMVAFIDQEREAHGVESICEVLPIAPSTFYRCKHLQANPEQRCARAQRDDELKPEIQRIYEENHRVYGARKVWKQLNREDVKVARCTVERLMKVLQVEGVRRGKRCVTTIPDELADKPLDLVNREFTAERSNQLWVADITYVATWSGFVYVAFVVDVFSRYIVGWRVLKSLQTDIVLDALEQALWARGKPRGVTHHSDRGSQYLSIRYTERLSEAGFQASVGSVGDSYDNALAETINGLFKAEVIHRAGPWKGLDEVEHTTLTWVDWFNHRRILGPIGDMPPAEYENLYYQQTESAQAA